MKKITLLPTIMLLGIGIFYSIQKLNIHLFEGQNSWPFLLILLGLTFLICGHLEQDASAILPGIILAGLGIHFHYAGKIASWPDHPAAFLFILSLGMILTATRTKNGYQQGLIILAIGLFLHFFHKIIQSLTIIENSVHFIETYWPLLFVVIGALMLVLRRRR